MGTRFVYPCLLALAACGGDMTGLQGIYTIDTWTENSAGCDAEGASILEIRGDTALYVKVETFFMEFVNVVPCDDIAECETMAGEADTIHLGDWIFEEGGDDSGWTYHNAFAFPDIDDQCVATGSDTVMTSPAEGMLRIEHRESTSEPYPPPGPDTDPCPDASAEEAVQGRPCESLEVLTASLDRGLP